MLNEMLKPLRRRPTIRSSERIYAIGDIHGRFDLFCEIIRRIRIDATHQPARKTRILVIGDMVDRGPGSADVIKRIFKFSSNSNLIVLRGNHEQMMIQSLGGDLRSLEAWLRFGGRETLSSWGLSDEALVRPLNEILSAARRVVNSDIMWWMNRLPLSYISGDFLFVHAGIRPGVALGAQSPEDLLWIGEEFTKSEAHHPAVIVHGHTICETGPELLRSRVGIDTGAYRTGRLSAVAFEGGRQWTLTATIPKAQR